MEAGADRINRAIDVLCSDDADALINEQIEDLERRLAKLKQFRKALLIKGRAEPKKMRWSVDEKLEGKVVSLIKKHGPLRSSDLATKIPGVSALTIGRMVAASRLLIRNDEKQVDLAEAE